MSTPGIQEIRRHLLQKVTGFTRMARRRATGKCDGFKEMPAMFAVTWNSYAREAPKYDVLGRARSSGHRAGWRTCSL